MPAVIVNPGSTTFGILSESFGVAQGFTQTRAVQVSPIVNHEGTNVGAAFYGQKANVSLTVLCNQMPTENPGGIVDVLNDIGLGEIRAQSISINKTNAGWMNATINGIHYPNLV